MKFMEYETNPGPGKMLITAVILSLVLAPFSFSYARPDVPPGKVSTPVYDYRDFTGPAVSQRVFDVTEGAGSYTVSENLVRPVPGELLVDREYRNATSLIRRTVGHFYATDTELLWDWSESYNSDNELLITSHFGPPLSVRQTEMPKGAMQGGGAVNTGTPTIPTVNPVNVTRVNTPLGLEDIHVPYGNGSLTGCLRMFEEQSNVSRISWYCPGVGLAKRLWGGAYDRVWELSECVGCPAP